MSNYAFRTCIFNIITCMVVYKVALNVYYCFVAALDYFLLIKYKRHMSTMSTQLHFWLLVSFLVLLKAHKTSLTQSKLVYPILFFIEVLVPRQESKQSCICVVGVSILPLSTIFLFNFRNVPTVWYFVFKFIMSHNSLNIMFNN
jgi:hypothetical protein